MLLERVYGVGGGVIPLNLKRSISVIVDVNILSMMCRFFLQNFCRHGDFLQTFCIPKVVTKDEEGVTRYEKVGQPKCFIFNGFRLHRFCSSDKI